MHTPIARSHLPFSAIRHALLPLRRLLPGVQPHQVYALPSRPTLLVVAAVMVIFMGSLASARAGAVFGGQETRSHGSRGDWSEDLGGDYSAGWVNESGQLAFAGNGTGSSSKPISTYYDSGFSLDWEVNPKGGQAGHSFAGGRAGVPESGNVEGRVFSYRLYSELGDNDFTYGIGSSTAIYQTHFFSLDEAFQPIYFKLRYDLTVTTDDQVQIYANLSNHFYGYSNPDIANGWLSAGTYHYEGVITGVLNTFDHDTGHFGSRSFFQALLAVSDGGGHPGSGRADLFVDLTYSSSPITEFPGSTPAVPETLPLLPTFAMAVAGLTVLRRRCAARAAHR